MDAITIGRVCISENKPTYTLRYIEEIKQISIRIEFDNEYVVLNQKELDKVLHKKDSCLRLVRKDHIKKDEVRFHFPCSNLVIYPRLGVLRICDLNTGNGVTILAADLPTCFFVLEQFRDRICNLTRRRSSRNHYPSQY